MGKGSDWLSPEAYNALSPAEKRALAARRRWEHRGDGLNFNRSRRRPRRSIGGYFRYQAMVIGAAVLAVFGYGLLSDLFAQRSTVTAMGSTAIKAHFSFCHTGGGYNCVVDGDTIWIEGQNVRIADIDAPETHEPRCIAERALGDRATRRLQQLVNSGAVTLHPIDRDTDSYGRKLRIVKVDGVSVGKTLVNDGLARWYAGGKRPWC